ncbi:ribonuclease III [Jutongia hominis]|jgi:ribonuclease-3|uniref:Ribonuclease 3 n=1 Tax=Jutongia hominis TaxID=2763664 RepID=A0ABR7MVL7_9FIRM|nr:ribonuclease III [Jutongia hominis]MBC8557302.1 ribonuclease III [Jutongia hominis]MEE0290598.1 ribonuclease III [Lachnospiraceae bacterium]
MKQEKRMEFEKRIGYSFKDPELLVTALTHSSYSNEIRLKKQECNERLEFLGDAVLELISSEQIFRNHPDQPEGDLTRIRASYVCEPTLALCAREICLGDYLQLGRGEDRTGGRERDSILSDAMEATIGAVYMDGGFESAQRYVEEFILKDIEKKSLFYDSKTYLQEIVQRDLKKLEYVLLKEEGPDHNKSFEVGVLIDGKQLTTAVGRTKKKAEQAAAYEAILLLEDKK